MILSLEVRFWRAIVTFGRRGLASNFGRPYLLVWQVIVVVTDLEPDTIAGPAIGARRQQRSNCAERDCGFVVVAIAHLAGFEDAVLLDPFE
jgi:hypothetical protein